MLAKEETDGAAVDGSGIIGAEEVIDSDTLTISVGAGGVGIGIVSVRFEGAGIGMGPGATAGSGVGTLSSGMSIGSNGAMGSGLGVTISTFGSGKGPIASPSSPVSPSGTEDGAATGSEKTGSILVVLVMSSIAFCKSLSVV